MIEGPTDALTDEQVATAMRGSERVRDVRMDTAAGARWLIDARRVEQDAKRKRRRAWRRAGLLGLGVASLVFFGGLVAAASAWP